MLERKEGPDGAHTTMLMSNCKGKSTRCIPIPSRWIGRQGSLFLVLVASSFVIFFMMSSLRDVPQRFSEVPRWKQLNCITKEEHMPVPRVLSHHPPNTSIPSSGVQPSVASVGSNQKQILLVTFGRSGSSFTSELIHKDPGVFYAFEPLYVMRSLQDDIYFRNTTQQDILKASGILHTFLSCTFADFSASILDNFQLRLSGPEIKEFYKCTKSVSQGMRHIDCYLNMIKKCKEKPTTFAKVIRFPLAWAETLLQTMPKLKILYLVRDPRAVLRSQAAVFRNFKWPVGLKNQSAVHCALMNDDLAALQKFATKYPGRVKPIRYESGAFDPVNYTKDIYTFTGLQFTNQTLEHIKSVTNAKGNVKALSNPYSLMKVDSLKAANSWRKRITFNSAKLIDDTCANFYPEYGYVKLKSREHLLSNESLFELKFNAAV